MHTLRSDMRWTSNIHRNNTLISFPPKGKQRSKSFNAGDRVKLAPSPTGTPPNGTPRSSPGNSPKPPRRHAMSKDMIKKRPSDLKKHDAQGRPHSDPIIAEKYVFIFFPEVELDPIHVQPTRLDSFFFFLFPPVCVRPLTRRGWTRARMD